MPRLILFLVTTPYILLPYWFGGREVVKILLASNEDYGKESSYVEIISGKQDLVNNP